MQLSVVAIAARRDWPLLMRGQLCQLFYVSYSESRRLVSMVACVACVSRPRPVVVVPWRWLGTGTVRLLR